MSGGESARSIRVRGVGAVRGVGGVGRGPGLSPFVRRYAVFCRRVRRLGSLAGSWRRVLILRATHPGVSVGFDSFVGPRCTFRCAPGGAIRLRGVVVGCGVHLEAGPGAVLDLRADLIGPNSLIVARERITVGPGSMLGEMTVVRDQDHVVDDRTPFSAMRYATAAVSVGRDVWVGARVTILRGVTIGDGAVVAAAALVNADVPGGVTVGGLPARPLRRAEPARPPGPPVPPGPRETSNAPCV